MNHIPAVLLIAAGLALSWAEVLGTLDRLPRNRFARLRTRRTLTSADGWQVIHAAAGPWLIAAALANLLTGLVLLTGPPGTITAAILGGALFFTLVLPVVGAVIGHTELRRRSDEP